MWEIGNWDTSRKYFKPGPFSKSILVWWNLTQEHPETEAKANEINKLVHKPGPHCYGGSINSNVNKLIYHNAHVITRAVFWADCGPHCRFVLPEPAGPLCASQPASPSTGRLPPLLRSVSLHSQPRIAHQSAACMHSFPPIAWLCCPRRRELDSNRIKRGKQDVTERRVSQRTGNIETC